MDRSFDQSPHLQQSPLEFLEFNRKMTQTGAPVSATVPKRSSSLNGFFNIPRNGRLTSEDRWSSDRPAKTRVGAEIYLAHTAFADHRQNLVVTKLLAGEQWHTD